MNNNYQLLEPDLIKINEHVIICLHYELCLVTELRDPEVPHDGFVGEIVVSVQEVSLDNVPVLLILLLQLLLLLTILRATKQEG